MLECDKQLETINNAIELKLTNQLGNTSNEEDIVHCNPNYSLDYIHRPVLAPKK